MLYMGALEIRETAGGNFQVLPGRRGGYLRPLSRDFVVNSENGYSCTIILPISISTFIQYQLDFHFEPLGEHRVLA